MATFFTSDLHVGHKNIVKYCNRPTTTEEHTDWIINQMNSVVQQEDDVYHVGDFAFLSNAQEIAKVLSLLKGNWKFILGNHDKLTTLNAAITYEGSGRHKVIGDYLRTTFDSLPVVLFHFPVSEWDRKQYGAIHLFGHMHGSPLKDKIPNRFEVGIDCHPDHLPFTLEDFKPLIVEGSRERSASSRGQ